LARENRNEDRKQRIRDAFQEGQTVERMPAREDMAPQQPEDVECRVAPYCRVSTMSEMQAESFEIQQQYYSEYIAKHPNWVLVRIYADEGISATSVKNRKEFNHMIEDCKAGKIDMIVTKSVSRFARNVVDCIKYARMLRSLSPPVAIYFETENINTLSQNRELLLTVLAAFAQDESVNKSISVAWGIRQRFAKGIPKMVKPYGYQCVDNKLVVDEEEAGVVIRIFYKRNDDNLTIANELKESLEDRIYEHIVSIECAWGQRIHSAACHGFYCGYRAALNLIDDIKPLDSSRMIQHTLLLEYHLGYIGSYEEMERRNKKKSA
jgi:DNA invertase Pin-like site-specific DNA recombinase